METVLLSVPGDSKGKPGYYESSVRASSQETAV